MFDIGWSEMLVIGVVALIVVALVVGVIAVLIYAGFILSGVLAH